MKAAAMSTNELTVIGATSTPAARINCLRVLIRAASMSQVVVANRSLRNLLVPRPLASGQVSIARALAKEPLTKVFLIGALFLLTARSSTPTAAEFAEITT